MWGRASIVCALLVTACAPATDVTIAPIVGGTASSEGAVMFLVGTGAMSSSTCTAVLIAPRIALTAANCVPPGPSYVVIDDPMFSGTGDGIPVLRVRIDPDYSMTTTMHDIAVIELASDAPAAPLAYSTTVFANAGDAIRTVGYGSTGPMTNDPGTRREGMSTLSSVSPYWFFDTGAVGCLGDGGGAVLAGDMSVETLGAIVVAGDPNCTFTSAWPLSGSAAFIEAAVQELETTDGGMPLDGGGVDAFVAPIDLGPPRDAAVGPDVFRPRDVGADGALAMSAMSSCGCGVAHRGGAYAIAIGLVLAWLARTRTRRAR